MILKRRCRDCGDIFEITVDATAYNRWLAGALIQECFPKMSADVRELLISGICGKCFDKIFK